MSENFTLVTGAAGFIGRWVVSELIAQKKKVIGIDNFRSSSPENIEDFLEYSDFIFIKGDITDPFMLQEVFTKYQIDHIIHLAAQINVQESIDYPSSSFQNNIQGTYNLLEAVRVFNKNIKITIVGTCMVYDVAQNKPISEDHPVKPASPYASSKLAAENLAVGYHHAYNIPVTIIRPFNTYGPYQRYDQEGGVVSIFISRKLNNEPLLIYGDGTQTRDLLYVTDCAEFIVNATFSNKTGNGEVFNIGTGKDIAIKDLAKLIQPDETMHKFVPHHHPQSEIQRLVCDYSKAKKVFNWEPKVTLEEGIKKLEQFMKSRV